MLHICLLQRPIRILHNYSMGKNFCSSHYNSKLYLQVKLVDLDTLICTSYAGTGRPGSALHKSDLSCCEFNEPGGVAVHEAKRLIFVADTNNHAIKVIDFTHSTIFQVGA